MDVLDIHKTNSDWIVLITQIIIFTLDIIRRVFFLLLLILKLIRVLIRFMYEAIRVFSRYVHRVYSYLGEIRSMFSESDRPSVD